MATDPRERFDAAVSQADLRMMVDAFDALSAELVEARRERDAAQARLARLEEIERKAKRVAKLNRDRRSTYGKPVTVDEWEHALWDLEHPTLAIPDEPAALAGGVAAETRDGGPRQPTTDARNLDTRDWPTCTCRNFGPYEYRAVDPQCRVHSASVPVGARRDPVELDEGRRSPLQEMLAAQEERARREPEEPRE